MRNFKVISDRLQIWFLLMAIFGYFYFVTFFPVVSDPNTQLILNSMIPIVSFIAGYLFKDSKKVTENGKTE